MFIRLAVLKVFLWLAVLRVWYSWQRGSPSPPVVTLCKIDHDSNSVRYIFRNTFLQPGIWINGEIFYIAVNFSCNIFWWDTPLHWFWSRSMSWYGLIITQHQMTIDKYYNMPDEVLVATCLGEMKIHKRHWIQPTYELVWPNGEGTRLRIWGLQVRVLLRAKFFETKVHFLKKVLY